MRSLFVVSGAVLLMLSALVLHSGVLAVLAGQHETWGILQPLALFCVPGIGATVGAGCLHASTKA